MSIGEDFFDKPAPTSAARSSYKSIFDSLLTEARAGQVIYLTGPGTDDEAVALVPVEVAKAGIAALGHRSQITIPLPDDK